MSVPDDRHLARVAVEAWRRARAADGVWIVDVPGALPTLNQRRSWGWQKRRRLDGELRDRAYLCLLAARVPELGRVRVDLTRYAHNRADPDNVAGGAKCVVDQIVRLRIADDDDEAHMRVAYHGATCKRGEERIELRIERWEGD